MATQREKVVVQGREVTVSNLEKVLYAGAKFKKGEVINYYIRIADYLLPHLKDRPVTLKRYPDGVSGQFFYEKDAPAFTPEWVQRFSVPRRGRGGEIHYILINNLPTLVWVANTASLELHPFLHRAPKITCPTEIVFDFDPGPGTDVLTCARVAFLVRDVLQELKLESFAKVSGSKGLQLYVPLNTEVTYEVAGPFAKTLAQLMEERHPDLIVSKMSKELRPGKIFIDWSQNSDFKTTIAVYSLRAKSDRPYVSLPVTWDELQSALDRKDPERLYFEPEEALKRVQKVGDLFAPVETLKQHLPPDVLDFSRYITRHTSKKMSKQTDKQTGKPAAKSLDRYREKRNFAKTPEPPAAPVASEQGGRRRFVIQKHAASHLHYDFRLEMHGVLKSWAVPKGPPLEADTKRLAMPTEDHPIEYLDFEGIIPQGEYGGGTVMVWDLGTYELVEGNYYKGFIKFYLDGKKLKGEWSLARSHENGDRPKWYLTKTGPEPQRLSAKKDDQSAISGRTMQQIARARERQWHSNRTAKATLKAPLEAPAKKESVTKARRIPKKSNKY